MITLRGIATAIAATTTIACISGIFTQPSNAATISADSGRKSARLDLDFRSISLADASIKDKSGITYVPPKRGTPRSGSTTGAGSRGCGTQSQPVSLTLLTPSDHTGQTTLGHPTFYWYVSKTTPVPMTFTLVEGKVGGKTLWEKNIQVQKAGIMQLEMAKELPELVPEREYRWSVALVCAPNRPSSNIVAKSWIKRVAIAPDQSSKLAAATSERDRAAIYAQGKLWYDALNSLAKAYASQQNDQSIQNDLLTLLKQVGITQITAESWQ